MTGTTPFVRDHREPTTSIVSDNPPTEVAGGAQRTFAICAAAGEFDRQAGVAAAMCAQLAAPASR